MDASASGYLGMKEPVRMTGNEVHLGHDNNGSNNIHSRHNMDSNTYNNSTVAIAVTA